MSIELDVMTSRVAKARAAESEAFNAWLCAPRTAMPGRWSLYLDARRILDLRCEVLRQELEARGSTL